MRSLFWGTVAVLIAWAVGFGVYGYMSDVTLTGIAGLNLGDVLLIRLSSILVWIGGIVFFGLLALILKPTTREL